jgi:hypothetical protein
MNLRRLVASSQHIHSTVKVPVAPASSLLATPMQVRYPFALISQVHAITNCIARPGHTATRQHFYPISSLGAAGRPAASRFAGQAPGCARSGSMRLFLSSSRRLQRRVCTQASGQFLISRPNPSVKRTANGVPPGPRYSAGLHFLQRGPGVTPSAAAYLER